MHRDVKLGLALGILVIGFAAAFCFPRQAAMEVTVSPATGLKLAAVDQEIRRERRRSFIGDELDPPEQPTRAEPALNPELPSLQTAAMRAQSALAAVPDPIQSKAVVSSSSEPAVVVTIPSMDAAVQIPEPPVDDVLYTVQPGDTLSAIAGKTLGTTRKFEAIYEANRDVMSTPNSLRVGMVLKIPQEAERIAKRGAAPPAKKPAESLADLSAGEPVISRKGMFSPVRRGPLGGALQAGRDEDVRR